MHRLGDADRVCASTSGAIGSAASTQALNLSAVPGGYGSDILVPTGVTVLASNSAVYVSAFDLTAYNPGAPSGTVFSTANPGWVFGFAVGSSGSLTAVPSSPFEAGVKPSALAAEPTNRFLYVTDYASNQLIGYTIMNSNSLSFLTAGPFKTGNEPSSLAIDPRGKFIYVANALDSSVSSYEITLANGSPSAPPAGSGSQLSGTDALPVAVAIDPALGRFVYTANHLGNSVSGFRLDPTSGALTPAQATPYPTSSEPAALVVVPHGNHATQSVAP